MASSLPNANIKLASVDDVLITPTDKARRNVTLSTYLLFVSCSTAVPLLDLFPAMFSQNCRNSDDTSLSMLAPDVVSASNTQHMMLTSPATSEVDFSKAIGFRCRFRGVELLITHAFCKLLHKD